MHGESEPRAASTFRLGARAHWHPTANTFFIAFVAFVPAVVMGAALRPFVHPMLGILIGLAFAVAALVFPQVTLTVGEDGLAVGRRFYGWGEIQSVSRGEHYGRGIVELMVRLRTGKILSVHCMVSLRETVLAEIAAMRARYDAGFRELDTAPLQRTRRGSATDTEWVTDLRAVGAGARLDHRTAPVSDEALWNAIESAGAPPPIRAAAAIAVSGSLDEAGRARLRETARSTASKKLRVALEAVVQERDDQALAEALAATEAELARKKKTA